MGASKDSGKAKKADKADKAEKKEPSKDSTAEAAKQDAGGDEVDYAELTLAELREHARDADIHGRSQMNKAELVDALEPPEEKTAAAKETGQAGAGDPTPPPRPSHGLLHPPRIWPD